MNYYDATSPPRLLVIGHDTKLNGDITWRIESYFDRFNLYITVDCVSSIERALLQMKYYDYDLALVSYRPAEDESGLDLLEIVERKKLGFPVIIVADPPDGANAGAAFKAGAVDFFVNEEGALARLPEAVDKNILKSRALTERARLSRNLREMNNELKNINETLARQSVRFLKIKKEQERERKKTESLLNSMMDGVIFVNSRGEIEMLNPAARRIFRLDDEYSDFSFADMTVCAGLNLLEMEPGEEASASIFSRDYRISAMDIEEEGSARGRMSVFHDVTREREVERLKAEFQSMISHELRTPLTAISGSVENFLRGNLGEVTDKQAEFLNMINRNVQRQMVLINDMLDIAKLEAKMMLPELSKLDAEKAAGVSVANFRYAFDEKGVKLSLETDGDLPVIMADGMMLTQILDNLLSNALKFTPKGGRVKLEVRKGYGSWEEKPEEPRTILFRVTDSGIGVSDDEKEKIFDSYYQVDSSSKREFSGTGLGLAICLKMAKLHNGSIVCADPEGDGGALFTLTLPVSAALRKKIMLIGGDPEHRKMDEEILGREFRIVTLEDGKEAVKKITGALPQLVLMDYHVPSVDGFEIFKSMKNNPATSKIPVIFVSGKMTEREKIRALKMGASDFVARPYSAGEFLARVKRVVDAR